MYFRSRALATALALTAGVSVPAFAHHPGGGSTGGAGPINTISASTMEQGHWSAGFTVDYGSLNQLSDAKLLAATAAGIDGVHGLKTIQSYALGLSYGVTNDFMIGVRLPFIKRTGIRAAEFNDDGDLAVLDHGNASGIGDLTALGQYRLVNDQARRLEVALLAGFIAPTGVTGRTSRQGELLDAEFQPGTGAWSGLLGAAITKRVGQWSYDASVLYAFTGTGTQNTNLGDRFSYNAAVSYRLTGLGIRTGGPMYHGGVPHDHEAPAGGPSLDLVLELNGEWEAKQRTLGIIDDQAGGNTIYISPGLRLSQDKWSSFVSVGIPVAKNLNGTQPDPDWRLRAGLGITF